MTTATALPASDAASGSPLRLFLTTGAMLVLFVAIDRKVLSLARLSEDRYAEPLLLAGLAERAGPLLLALALVAALALLRYGALARPWASLGEGPHLRRVVVFLAALLAWPLVTQGFNPYLGQSHPWDVLLTVALVAALWWRPGVILLLLPLLAVLLTRVTTPVLGGSLLVHKLQIFHLLSLFAAAVLVHAVTARPILRAYLYLALCLIAGSYFIAAYAKLVLEWWSVPHLHLLPVSAFAHGWLEPVGPDGIGALSRALVPLDLPARIVVLVLETACLLMLAGPRIAAALLLALVGFHLGVFALYGFFFWTWIGVDLALVLLVLKTPDRVPAGQRIVLVVLGAALIAAAPLWSRPSFLGWFDTGLTYTYRVEANGSSGNRYTLAPEYFAPYSDVFTMTPFHYLTREHAVLTASYGVTKDVVVARGIAQARSVPALLEVERELGQRRFNEAHARRLQSFLRRFVAGRNRHGHGASPVRILAPPGQFVTQRIGVHPAEGETLESLEVIEVTTFFDGHVPRIARRRTVLEVGVDAATQSRKRSSAEVSAISQ